MAIVLVVASVGQARTITIRAGGTGDYPTIQAGIDAAASAGDAVVLQPGTYTGPGNRASPLVARA